MSVDGSRILIGVMLLIPWHHVIAQATATSTPPAGSLRERRLDLILRPSKQEYAPGEPIYLILDVLNRGNVPAEIPFGCCEQHITVSGPSLPEPSQPNPKETEVQVCSCPVVFTKVLSGKSYRERLLLNKPTGDEWSSGRLLIEHYELKRPGTYKVKIARAVGSNGSSGAWLYAEVGVKVTERQTNSRGFGPHSEDRWQQVLRGRLAKVEVDRRLYQRRKDEDCFIAFRVTNVTNRPVGVDLREFWNVIYPNSQGFSKTPEPEVVDEERIIRGRMTKLRFR